MAETMTKKWNRAPFGPERVEEITQRIPAGRWGQPEDLVGAAIFLASHASDYVDGIALPVDGGWLGR